MTDFRLIAGILNLAGPDLIVIFLILLMMAGSTAGLIALICYIARRKSPPAPPPLPTARPAAERLAELDRLKEQSRLTEGEYEEQRRKIISEI